MTVLRSNFMTNAFQDFYEEILRQKEKALRESETTDLSLEESADKDLKALEQTANRERLSLLNTLDDTDILLDDLGEGVHSDSVASESIDTALDNSIEEALRKERLAEGKTNPLLDKPDDQVIYQLCQNIQRKLRIFLEEQSLSASYQLGEYAQSNFREAQYLMAALSDEIFLNLHWLGQKQWAKHLLETQLFQTQVAGELFFTRLDVLLNAADPTRNELAMVYFLCLSLGFRGKYRDLDDEGAINYYKKKLYHLVHNRESDLFTPGRKYLSNTMYEHNLTLPLSKGLPDIRHWLFTFGGIACVYLFVTYVLWYKLVRELDEALQFIFDQARFLPL